MHEPVHKHKRLHVVLGVHGLSTPQHTWRASNMISASGGSAVAAVDSITKTGGMDANQAVLRDRLCHPSCPASVAGVGYRLCSPTVLAT